MWLPHVTAFEVWLPPVTAFEAWLPPVTAFEVCLPTVTAFEVWLPPVTAFEDWLPSFTALVAQLLSVAVLGVSLPPSPPVPTTPTVLSSFLSSVAMTTCDRPVLQFLEIDPKKRLGGPREQHCVLDHPLYRRLVNWEALQEAAVRPPPMYAHRSASMPAYVAC